jgi:hypothetical protein
MSLRDKRRPIPECKGSACWSCCFLVPGVRSKTWSALVGSSYVFVSWLCFVGLWLICVAGDSVLWLLGRRLNLFSRDSHQVRSGFPSGKKDPHDFSKNRACLLEEFKIIYKTLTWLYLTLYFCVVKGSWNKYWNKQSWTVRSWFTNLSFVFGPDVCYSEIV